jgi:c-di-GMP-binding flagellar brake protein YcgR
MSSPFGILLGILIAAALAFFVIRIVKKRRLNKRKSAVKKGVMSLSQFQQKLALTGFTASEVTLLYETLAEADLEVSEVFLTSFKMLDTLIKHIMQKFASERKDTLPASQALLGKLLERRKRLTIQKINMRKPLSTSREIPAGKDVRVVLAEVGIFTTQVQAYDGYFAILSPLIYDTPTGFRWENRKAMILFHKMDDGEYSFVTTVEKEIEDEKTGEFILLLHHQETLSRAQKRKSVRMPLKKQAYIYPADNTVEKAFVEGRACALSNISDTGCLILMAGNVNMPRFVIVQFMIDGRLVTISGECQSVKYDRTINVTSLHIKANSIPRDVKNIILSVIFGIIEHQDDKVVISEAHDKENGRFPRAGEPLLSEDDPEKAPDSPPLPAVWSGHQPAPFNPKPE